MDVTLITLQYHGDARGSLVVMEENKNVPFPVKRIYYLFDTARGERRGFHAHKKLQQLAVVVKGTCWFHLDDGKEQQQVFMDNPAQALLLPPMLWHEMFDFSEDCVLMVLADDFYDESDYIRNYQEFMFQINGYR
jgi:dTDP-4-dehydrorhamnose 3,5-epimerase-like enzyme